MKRLNYTNKEKVCANPECGKTFFVNKARNVKFCPECRRTKKKEQQAKYREENREEIAQYRRQMRAASKVKKDEVYIIENEDDILLPKKDRDEIRDEWMTITRRCEELGLSYGYAEAFGLLSDL